MVKGKPEWLRMRLSDTGDRKKVETILRSLSLHTVCQEADCPNLTECFGRGTATFMILGSICSRNCRFCSVTKGTPPAPDKDEPAHIAQAVSELKLKHVVITTVTRDDLPDGGAGQFQNVIREIRKQSPGTTIEVLISDLQGDREALRLVTEAKPEIIGHNIETVARLYPAVRPLAVYARSLAVLKDIKALDGGILTKSSIMVGLGETRAEMTQTFLDLRAVDCDILTIGQYLAPSKKHIDVQEFVHPDVFKAYEEEAYSMGFQYVVSGPMVRSSYRAEMVFSSKSAPEETETPV